MYDSVSNDNVDSVSDDINRVSGVVDNDYDRNDKDKDEHIMPYDKETEDVPYDSDNENIQMTVIMTKCLPNMPMIMRQPQIK